MGFTVKTLKCNGLCRSCYENAIRKKGQPEREIDIGKILDVIEQEGKKDSSARCNSPTLHGGEPLLLSLPVLECLLGVIHKYWKQTGVQTNGTLITDEHIRLFKKYNTHVGVSIDGDTFELNRGRWNAADLTDVQIQEHTDQVLSNMRKVRDAGLRLSVISLLRSYNASTSEKILRFINFLFRLKREFGVVDVRTNPVIVFNDEFRDEELTNDELGAAFVMLFDVSVSAADLCWLPYRDVVDLMMGFKKVTCNFLECDIWKTNAESPIDVTGMVGNCLKGGAAIDGVFVMATETASKERYAMLKQISEYEGGCKDCRYWFICKGGCPGEGIDNDWRNKDRFCEAWKILFQHVEEKLKSMMPNLLLAPDFYPNDGTSSLVIQSISGSAWTKNARKTLEQLTSCKVPDKNSGHGDTNHGDSEHGDRPHGDGHGDANYDLKTKSWIQNVKK